MDTTLTSKWRTVAIIPARYASTRLPGKLLLDLGGKSVLQRVYDNAVQCLFLQEVIVAADSEEILAHCEENDMKCLLTSTSHQSGTDRVAEVAAQFQDVDIIINIQGDEPFFSTNELTDFVQFMWKEHVSIGTLACPINSAEQISDPSKVKVVMGTEQQALYFSRAAIPFLRGVELEQWPDQGKHFRHVGVYGFKMPTLLSISKLSQGCLELSESLEQLRWLENGFPIHVLTGAYEGFGIDTAEDYEYARRHFSG